MVLPNELLLYAENFYRRFPEEFVALGAPGLEEVFDLRAFGTKSRRITETPSEKTVEITIRRWNHPHSLTSSAHLGYPLPDLPPALGLYDAPSRYGLSHWPRPEWGYPTQQNAAPPWPSAAAPPAPPAAPAAPQPHFATAPAAAGTEEYAAAQLTRLESAIMMLKPQVEAALANQQEAQKSKTQPAAPPKNAQVQPPDVSMAQAAATDGTLSPESPLRERRNLGCLSIMRPEREMTKGAGVHTAAVKEIPRTNSEPSIVPNVSKSAQPTAAAAASSSMPAQAPPSQRTLSKEQGRPSALNCIRVASTILDPESPRSPGKYSAWK